MNINSEENMKKLLQAVCKPVVASPEFNERLLNRLTHTLGGAAKTSPLPLWRQPKLLVPIAAVIILAVIGYGIWLSQAVSPSVTPPLTPPPTPSSTPPPTVVSSGILLI